MSITIRKLKENEFAQAIKLADHTFRDQDHLSMGEAFPHVFSQALSQSFGAFDGERLVSFIGLVPSKIKVGAANLNVFSIGSVCTHEDYRKQGISSAILKEVYSYIDQAHAALLFVSGDRGLYMRNNCYHFGRAYKFSIETVNVSSAGIVRQGTEQDIFQIDALRAEKDIQFDSSIWEWSMLLEAGGYTSISKMKQKLYISENQGQIEGYVVLGIPTEKSTKDKAIVTEFGGDPKAIQTIIQALLVEKTVSKVEMTIPWHETSLEAFKDNPYELINHGGTVHIVNVQRFWAQITPYLMTRDPEITKKVQIEEKDHNIVLKYNDRTLNLTMGGFVDLLFSEQKDDQMTDLGKIFPIPLPHTMGLYYV